MAKSRLSTHLAAMIQLISHQMPEAYTKWMLPEQPSPERNSPDIFKGLVGKDTRVFIELDENADVQVFIPQGEIDLNINYCSSRSARVCFGLCRAAWRFFLYCHVLRVTPEE